MFSLAARLHQPRTSSADGVSPRPPRPLLCLSARIDWLGEDGHETGVDTCISVLHCSAGAASQRARRVPSAKPSPARPPIVVQCRRPWTGWGLASACQWGATCQPSPLSSPLLRARWRSTATMRRDAGGRPRRGAHEGHEGHEGHDGDAIGIGYNKPPDVASSGRLTALLLLIPQSFFGIDRNRNPQSSTIVRCRGRDSSHRVVRSAVGGPLYCKSRMNPDFRHISTRPSPTTRSKTRDPHQHQSHT